MPQKTFAHLEGTSRGLWVGAERVTDGRDGEASLGGEGELDGDCSSTAFSTLSASAILQHLDVEKWT